MDSSLEIIEVKPSLSSCNNYNNNDIEVIYQNSSKNKASSSCRHPQRQRKNVVRLQQEQAVELDILLQKKQKRQGMLLTRPGKSVLEKKKVLNSTANVKRKLDEDSPTPKKSIKTEAGGAGTVRRTRKDSDLEIIFEWNVSRVIAERQQVSEWQAGNIVTMFEKENTLPFIARYRKDQTGNIDVEKLREIQNSYNQLKHVQERVIKILKGPEQEKITEEQKNNLLNMTTIQEVEHIASSLKKNASKSYAARARELGLQPTAKLIMQGDQNKFTYQIELMDFVDSSRQGLKTIEEVQLGLQHIIADSIRQEPSVMKFVENLMKICMPHLECVKAKKVQKKSQQKKSVASDDLVLKYTNYFDYRVMAWNAQPHAILAINRGEQQGVLTVTVSIPVSACMQFTTFCKNKWFCISSSGSFRTLLIMKSIEDCWERLVKPSMKRRIRSELTERAEISSVQVFAKNLRKLLMTPPLRGKPVLAIDPGFQNGCKIGVVGTNGEKLLTTTIYPLRKENSLIFDNWSRDHNAVTLREIVAKYGCELFVIGNGKGCRETEAYLSKLISCKCFHPINVQYTILDESGISHYSVSAEAKAEFSDVDPCHISAISLARRLQDPLLEYVKVHPMHLGVGMYQHDISERILNGSLDSVMTECISFVGLDLNVASEFALRKLSGLTKLRAQKIVEYRKTKGPFINREQLKSVKMIGPKTYEQCAGFVCVRPSTISDELQSFCATKCLTTDTTMQLIIEALCQPQNYDLRMQFQKPLFRKGMTSLDDISIGSLLSGRISNVTSFGAFVDVGVGENGLIHSSKMRGFSVELGNIVEVIVDNIERSRKRLSFKLVRVIG